jgi:hypothetical protein
MRDMRGLRSCIRGRCEGRGVGYVCDVKGVFWAWHGVFEGGEFVYCCFWDRMAMGSLWESGRKEMKKYLISVV